MTTFIYALCEPGTRTVRYIGKANRPEERFRKHLQGSIKNKSHLGAWLRKLKNAEKEPTLVILKEVPIEEWANEETRYIQSAKILGFKLVNSTAGGEGINNPSPETRKLLSEQKLGDKNPMFGIRLVGRLNPMFGKTGADSPQFGLIRSPETCAKIRAKALGRKRKKGQIHSPETLAKMGKSQTARWEKYRQGNPPRFCYGHLPNLKRLPCFVDGGGI